MVSIYIDLDIHTLNLLNSKVHTISSELCAASIPHVLVRN